MPVPVPFASKPPAHPVRKIRSHSGAHPSIHTLTHSLPHPPPGPPPSYGTREQWISSLPEWRRTKPRRIWEEDDSFPATQGFLPGLTNADNASVIKGPRAQACIPPQISPTDSHHSSAPFPVALSTRGDNVDDDEMDDSFEFDIESQWSAHSAGSDDSNHHRLMDIDNSHIPAFTHVASTYTAHPAAYDRGAFTPVFEAISPDHDDRADPGSSPLGPVTPFGEFVDRAVATVGYDRNQFPSTYFATFPSYAPKTESAYIHPPPFEPHQEPVLAPISEPVPAPSSTATYKKVADPLADWMALYVWKSCTTGMSLPRKYLPRTGQHELRYSSLPPPYLANAVRSLFMSTLLQPSAILLAVWYIVRLPVCFGAMDNRPERPEERYFRTELLGLNEWRGIDEREAIQMDAAFRLVLLGCMLANKWLDDHTFSNKTWHAISGIPIQSLNRLECHALGIFAHNLSVPTPAWMQWLDHVLAHQAASSPIGPPQPISRPSSDPRVIVRRTVEHLIDVSNRCATPRPCDDPRCIRTHIEPVFVSQEERKTPVEQTPIELEIDLDEDGPLREEYMPKRRVSRAAADRPVTHGDDWAMERSLPPPAKWSPNADEPLVRGTNDRNRQYVAVQAPPAPLLQPTRMYAHWGTGPVAPPKMQLPPIYAPPPPPLPATVYPHMRSMSLSSAPPPPLPQSIQEPLACHARSQSQSIQSHFEYACSDMRMTAANPSYQESYWPIGVGAIHPEPYRNTYGYHPFDTMQFPPPSNWIRV